MTIKEKKEKLISMLKQFDSLLVAFSGGVDSMLLLAVAQEALKEKLVAVTAKSQVHPLREFDSAVDFVKRSGIRHMVIESSEMDMPEFVVNNRDRCYVCKKNMIVELKKIAQELKIKTIAHGVNLDDLDDYRPGLKAALEMDVKSPLADAGLSKKEIRELSKEMGLPAWNKPSQACLATRIPYGSVITVEDLKKIEKAEDFILNLGFRSCRVRLHGDTARIEIDPDEIENMMKKENREAMITKFRQIGFVHTAVDLEGYIQGSMNR